MNRILAAAVALALCAPAYADSLPPGLQCDIAVTMTTEPGHKVKTMQTQVGIKFIDNNYWRVLSQDGILKSDAKLTPMRITDQAYVLQESSDETLGRGVHMISSPLTIDRKTGEYSLTADGDMPKAPGVAIHTVTQGHCTPADL